jgi:hypothetical protein
LGDPLKGNLLLLYKPLHLEAQQVSTRIEVRRHHGHAPMWKKKSIFWELEYWKFLEVRSAIDVMHMTKNLCVNLLGFLGLYGKTKDTPKARED